MNTEITNQIKKRSRVLKPFRDVMKQREENGKLKVMSPRRSRMEFNLGKKQCAIDLDKRKKVKEGGRSRRERVLKK